VPAIAPQRAWELISGGHLQVLDLRTEAERRRYGWPPGARRVSLARHILWPGRSDTVYLCQHAVRSKLTGRRGASEIAGGWVAWTRTGLPAQRHSTDTITRSD
jgi:rhodanese-related sulfurtransferase